jgi:hypothetical protein
MTYDKWLETVERIENGFQVLQKLSEPLEGPAPGRREIIEFESPAGRLKLVWTEKARLEKLKTSYSRRIGSQVQVQAQYSQTDKVNYLNAYKWDDSRQDWQPFEFNLF